ncbi:hypothetical protein GCM10025864_12070 [Luteimicrobium album]|uniref:Uncharacterized protein n=1 Tax=Luteimicrobium album TaxID=1054550 RepID=A0ABQ6HZV3_9MICO|nr:hypothetical protein [Luteimicrobium album]GMA23448.1 hypothetical protein GCM10025864_12070 [Luteimicrobium album]
MLVVVGVLVTAGCAIQSDAASSPPALAPASTGPTASAADDVADGQPGPAPTSSSGVTGDARCTDGKPVAIKGYEVGAFEGWWNSTPADADGDYSDPSTWPKEVLQHPATARVVTDTGHVLEVCDRGTGLDVAGYTAPKDHHGWPRHSVVLLDARTGKLLATLSSGSAGAWGRPVSPTPRCDVQGRCSDLVMATRARVTG